MKQIATLKITKSILDKLNAAIEIALDFEKKTGKSKKIINLLSKMGSFKSIGGVRSAQTGSLLNKAGKVPFHYALLVILDVNYKLIKISRLSPTSIKSHFDRINKNRIAVGKLPRKTMSISQFESIALKQTRGGKRNKEAKRN